MKKFFTLALAGAMAMSVCACGSSGNTAATTAAETETASAEETTAASSAESDEAEEEISTDKADAEEKDGKDAKDKEEKEDKAEEGKEKKDKKDKKGGKSGDKTSDEKEGGKGKKSSQEDGVAGYYKMTGVTEDGEESEEFDSMAESGLQTYLVVNEDGTAYLDMFGQQIDMTWDDKYVYFYEEDEEEEAEEDADSGIWAKYSYKDGVLSCSTDENDFVMTFTKLDEEELEDYLENGSGDLGGLLGGLGEELGSLLGEDYGGTRESHIPEGEPSEGPVSGKVGKISIEILGAEAITDGSNSPAIRFYYDYTNGTDELVSSSMDLEFEAAQDGEALDMTWLDENAVPEDEYWFERTTPGTTLRCALEYSYDPDGGTVGFRIYDASGKDELLYYVDPKDLPGAPEEAFVIEAQSGDPDFMKDVEASDKNVKIEKYEFGKDENGEDMLRVYYEFTNNSKEENSFFMLYTAYAVQDGVELPRANPEETITEDDNLFEEIKPGKSIVVAVEYTLRSKSPVAAVAEEDASKTLLGEIIEVS